MVRELKQHSCSSVVDLCCGTGLFAGMAQEAGLVPSGVDISSHMLEVGREKYPDIHFVEADATATDFVGSSFDAVTVSFGLHEKPEAVARGIFREALRLTRPGGVILVADYRLPDEGVSPFTKWIIRLVERVAGREHYRCFKAYMTRGGTQGFLEREGVVFDLVRTSMSGWSGLFAITR
jgi:ubiquinone/menaquinone biosynthesis C-methylase UbiE